jgi:TPR repeat protein
MKMPSVRWRDVLLVASAVCAADLSVASASLAAAPGDILAKAEAGDAVAQYQLGQYYLGQGFGDYPEAVKWFRKAAGLGYADAEFLLGGMCERGEGTPKDYAEAVKWYRKAAEQGHLFAEASLAYMYATGQGVPKDYVQAYKWSYLAAARGDPGSVWARDTLASHMTPAQLTEAQRLAREWKPTPAGHQN